MDWFDQLKLLDFFFVKNSIDCRFVWRDDHLTANNYTVKEPIRLCCRILFDSLIGNFLVYISCEFFVTELKNISGALYVSSTIRTAEHLVVNTLRSTRWWPSHSRTATRGRWPTYTNWHQDITSSFQPPSNRFRSDLLFVSSGRILYFVLDKNSLVFNRPSPVKEF